MTFSSPDQSVSLTLNIIIGFVDDTICMAAGDPNKPLIDMLEQMQHDKQFWNNLLWASGGRLELPKCGYHTIYYQYHDSSIPYIQHHHWHQISLTAPNRENIPIGPKNVYMPHKNLGHYKAPGGNYTTQQATILKKATTVTAGIILPREPAVQKLPTSMKRYTDQQLNTIPQ